MKRRFALKLLIAICIVSLMTASIAQAQSGGLFVLRSSTIDGGGGFSAGGAFKLSGTAGQMDAGTVSGGEFMLRGGFWQPAGTKFIYLPAVFRRY